MFSISYHRDLKSFRLFLGIFFLIPSLAWPLTLTEQNTIKIFQSVADSVVFITNVSIAQTFSFDGLESAEIPRGTGSGFVWDKKGHVVTNFHVISGGDIFYVTFRNQKRYKAKIVGSEPRKDLAVLKIQGNLAKIKLKPIRLGSSKNLIVGQKALAIGNPYGLDHTLTVGVISALDRRIKGVAGVTIKDVIQTDASINPGNSGGPLLDSTGKLIGMNTAIYSQSGSSAGIGFAVPVAFIKKLVPQIIQYGKVIQPGLGITISSSVLMKNLPGVVIESVNKGSAADRAGLRGMFRTRFGEWMLGDIIIAIDGKPINSYDELYHSLEAYKVGDRVKIKILRGVEKKEVTVKLQRL